jgi:hypothetical protein
MTPLPFRAFLTVEPSGVMSFDSIHGFRLWRVTDWLKHRGGMRIHYGDLAAQRTIVVDHLEFLPAQTPGLDYDVLGRRIARVSLAMALGIAFTNDIGGNGRLLYRCFPRDEANRMLDALHALARSMRGEPQESDEASSDLQAATVYRDAGVIVLR